MTFARSLLLEFIAAATIATVRCTTHRDPSYQSPIGACCVLCLEAHNLSEEAWS